MEFTKQSIITEICDKMCKYPYISESDDELKTHCDNCPAEEIVNTFYGCKFEMTFKALTNAYEKMQMQAENHKIDPATFPEPSFDMFKDFLIMEKEKENNNG